MARNFEIINTLQTQVEPDLFERPGAYDGRKNLFMSFELPFENGSREVGSDSLITTCPANFTPRFPVRRPYGSPAVTGRGYAGRSRPIRV